MLELLKVIVRAVVIERDPDGNIVGEQLSEPQALYTPEQYDEWLASVRAELGGANAQAHPDNEESEAGEGSHRHERVQARHAALGVEARPEGDES